MVNRNDVAKRAGVAPSTVSHVINGTKYVSEEIKEKVQSAIKELDYEPNLLARSFKMNSTKQIMIFISMLQNFEEIYEGMQSQVKDSNYSLCIMLANDKCQNYYQQCYSRRVDGIINLSRFFCSDYEYEKLRLHGIANVNVLPSRSDYEVSINYVNAVEGLVKDLHGKNRKNIAFLADTSRKEIEPDSRLIAFKYFLGEYGLEFREPLIYCFEDNPAELDSFRFGYCSCRKLFENNPETDAVFCVNDMIAMGAYQYLNETGRSVPDDVSVCGSDDINFGKFLTPQLSTMSVNKVEFGKECMRNIFIQLKGEENAEKSRKIILYADYIPRGSV